MKITDIELHEIHPQLQAWNRDINRLYIGDTWDTRTIIVLRTDNGLEGLGEYNGAVSESLQEELDLLRGTNPCRWLAHPERTIWVAPAIYDLVGKANDVPAYQLFGPKVRSWVPVSSWTVSQTPAKMAEEVEHAVEQGYTWIKYHTQHSHFHNIIDQTRAMQEVAPRGFKVHYDVNLDSTADHIIEIAKELSQFPVAGLIEDPVRSFDLEGYKLLRQKCALPIVFHHLPLGGREALMGLADGYMMGHAPVGMVVRRAGLFEAANVPFMMQNGGGNITRAFVAHMAAAFDRATLHHVTCTHMWEEDVVEPLEVVAGQVQVPEKPGLGVELDRDELERLKAAVPAPMPKALIRVRVEGAPSVYARPPMLRNSHLKVGDIPGVGEGYNQRADQDFWHDDGSEKFAALWEQTADRAVFE
jgi:D-galactarolactone cycloisomerase